MNLRVAVGLSGGVDSSVAAALLVEKGYEVTGVYITCWMGPGCRSEEDRKDALDIAMQLDIPFVHLDYQKEYKDKVYEYMIDEYEAGRTPNPDAVCNREIKFGLFYDWSMANGYDYVATGHYAQVENDNQQFNFGVLDCLKASGSVRQNKNCRLFRSKDEHKDQTYFLYQLRKEQLEHILFPIGHLLKQEVRKEAEMRQLLTAKKPDSQGICFIGELPMEKFLEQRITPKAGKIYLQDVEVGTHKGVWFYTIGQRISLDQRKIIGYDPQHLPHFYVVDKDIEKNILYVGTDEKLLKSEIVLGDIHWIGEELKDNLLIRIRHTGELIPIKSLGTIDQTLIAALDRPVRAVAPGQVAVIYASETCLGGGIIQ